MKNVWKGASEIPRYKHDCDKCVYLGQHENYDLYYCEQSGLPTVICRWGNNGCDYHSGLYANYEESVTGYRLTIQMLQDKINGKF